MFSLSNRDMAASMIAPSRSTMAMTSAIFSFCRRLDTVKGDLRDGDESLGSNPLDAFAVCSACCFSSCRLAASNSRAKFLTYAS